MLTARNQRVLFLLTFVAAVACLVYGAQRRVTVFNGRPPAIAETKPGTVPDAEDEWDALDEECPPLEDLPSLDEGSPSSMRLDEAGTIADAATTAAAALAGTRTEPQPAAQRAAPPSAPRRILWRGLSVGEGLPWDADESKQVEVSDLRMIELGTFGGMHRSGGKLHLTFDIGQGMPAPGKQACPT